jgi:hypothetical protein
MLSRALSLAAASLVGCLVATASHAQNLEAGKSPVQIFNSNCTACHRSAKGLLKTVAPSSLPGFLRQHYTTGSEMAQMLSGFLMSNGAGAADARVGTTKRGGKPETSSNLRPDAPIGSAAPDAGQGKDQGKDKEQAARPERKPRAAATAKPDADGIPGEGVQTPSGRKLRQPKPDIAARPEGAQPPAETGVVAGSKGGAKQKLARKNRKGEPPKAEPVAPEPTPEIVAKPELKPEIQSEPPAKPASERAIDAAVPVPEPVGLPPPTAADIKPEPAPAEAPKAAPEKAVTEAQKPSPAPASAAPSAAVVAPAAATVPPISH